ncbi:MAG: hypothetical protein HYZ28_03745 [Myxococcales bacterium]|nr:hypothetical protein [Myxococcales bacterium]
MSPAPRGAWAATLLALACASPKGALGPKEGPAGGPVASTHRISNLSTFDLASCTPAKIELPGPANQAALVGGLLAVRPHALECLVDPSHRGPATDTSVSMEISVSSAGVERKALGPNLSEEGRRCIEGALRQVAAPPLGEGSATVAGKVEVRHSLSSPRVDFGINEISDLAGRVRLAQASWCECYSPWAGRAPPSVRVKLKLAKGKPVQAEPEPPPVEASALASCLEAKLEALPLAPAADEITLTYPFLFVSSETPEAAPGAVPDLAFAQLEASRARRASATALRLGARVNAVAAYDSLVKQYKARPSSTSVRELKERCAELGKANSEWIAALAAQLDADKRTQALTAELKEKDPGWSEVEMAARESVKASEADLAEAERVKGADQSVCPKEIPGQACCKVCGPTSRPCGDACISLKQACHKPRGCACP